jgi:hypothetical protein
LITSVSDSIGPGYGLIQVRISWSRISPARSWIPVRS